jgi:hypothetical protein
VPLHGHHLLDLAFLVPGLVTPSKDGFVATPSHGIRAVAMNTAGAPEETVNYMIDGIAFHKLVFSSILFHPRSAECTASK